MKSRMGVLTGIVMMGFGMLGLGCYAETGTYVATESVIVHDDSPTLVAVEPGVWVVSRQPTAVYYVDNSYWTNRGDIWYRSSAWDDGWIAVRTNVVPHRITYYDSTRYAYYHPSARQRTRALPQRYYASPSVHREQARPSHRVIHNEMGSPAPARHNSRHHKHGPRGHGHGR